MREIPRLALVLLSAGLMGCFGAKKKPLIPVVPLIPAAPVTQPESLPRAPGTSIPPVVRMPPAPQAPAVRRRIAPPPVPVPAVETEPPPLAPPPSPPPPQLGVNLAPSVERQFRADLDRLMASARAAMAGRDGQTLSAAQRETVERIRSFLEQAGAARDKDPATALQLARRADLLGQDLVKSLPRK